MTVGADSHRSGRRGGREQVTEAVLQAAELLFTRSGYKSVTVRKIATQAGVSHALVHRYLGSKREIFETVLARHEQRMVDSAAGLSTLHDVAVAMLRENRQHTVRTLSLIARAAMDGLSYELIKGAPATRALVAVAQRQADAGAGQAICPDIDPRVLVAGIIAMAIGWFSSEEWLLKATGLDKASDVDAEAGVERLVTCLIDVALPHVGVVDPS